MVSNTTGVQAVDDAAAALDHGLLRTMYETMLLARAVDERMWLLNRAGKAPFAVSGQGHEAAQAGMVYA
ncbi:MAG: thiamine pyrophosphate-dependent dehydrogenase E1 component subunit alpha, partial [Chloroflexota bacterium]